MPSMTSSADGDLEEMLDFNSMLSQAFKFSPSKGAKNADLEGCIDSDNNFWTLLHFGVLSHGEYVKDTSNMNALNSSVESYQTAIENMPTRNLHKASVFYALALMLKNRFEHQGMIGDLEDSIVFHRKALGMRPPPHTDRSASLGHVANGLVARFSKLGSIRDIDEAILLYRDKVALHPFPHPLYAISLNNFALTLKTRFQQMGSIEDLEEAILLHRGLYELFPQSDPLHITLLSNLAVALGDRFRHLGSFADSIEAINLHRAAVKLCPPLHQHRPHLLSNFACDLSYSGSLENVEEAIKVLRELRRSSQPVSSAALNNLATALLGRFRYLGSLDDLEELILLYRDILALRPFPHPDRYLSLNNLGTSLSERFYRLGLTEDLENAILLHREALALCPSPHPGHLNSLGHLAVALDIRFRQFGVFEVDKEAIVLTRNAIELCPPSHPRRLSLLNNLAIALDTQFNRFGSVEYLNEAITLQGKVLSLRPSSGFDRSLSLNNLAYLLYQRFTQMGMVGNLDKAILLYREALRLHSSGHSLRPSILNNLVVALDDRFKEVECISDLEEASLLSQESISLRTPQTPGHALSLNNHVMTLDTRFSQYGSTEDINKIILLFRDALSWLSPSHTYRATLLDNCGLALNKRLGILKSVDDIEESISFHRAALALRPIPHLERVTSVNNLACALTTRFRQLGSIRDLREATLLYQDALSLIPQQHPIRSNLLYYSSAAFECQFTESKDKIDLEKAICALKDGCGLPSSFFTRFRMAWQWARVAQKCDHHTTLEAYMAAMNLLPRLVSLRLDLTSRQEILRNTDGLARAASAYAFQIGDTRRAIELLEAGRATFWKRTLRLYTPFDKLHTVNPGLAQRLRRLSSALRRGYRQHHHNSLLGSEKRWLVEKQISKLARLDRDWDETVEKVRRIDGFDDFLLPKALPKLQIAANIGPIVMLNATDSGSQALIITTSGIDQVSLSRINSVKAKNLVSMIRKAMTNSGRNISDEKFSNLEDTTLSPDNSNRTGRPTPIGPRNLLQTALKILWADVVEPVIRLLGLKKASNPPILQWCPAGPFSFLPLHGAGRYREDMTSIDCSSDYIISTYTPAIEALLLPRPSPSNDDFQMMTIIQSDGPKPFKPLPYTVHELRNIEKHVPEENLIELGIPGKPASIESVLSGLSTASIVHFACHGCQVEKNPLDSALILEDGPLTISNIIQHKTPNARLVYLSACETAMGDRKAPDEAMHLGASLLFSGFRCAIATMWSIADNDGPTVADAFYKKIFEDRASLIKNPDSMQPAIALHNAVAKLRAEKAPFHRWIPFICLGN